MTLRNIDILSPEITLFYYGNRRHATNFGAILTLLLILISIFYIINLIINISHHEISNYIFYRSYMTNISHYYFNDTSGIFHYFQLYDTKTKTFGEYNPKYIRIFMSRIYQAYQENLFNLSDNEHWVYDLCTNGIDNKNINKDVFDKDKNKTFEISACLKYYYDNITHTYYNIDDKYNFKYPYLVYGTGNNNNIFLETIIEKCENSSVTNKILGNCGQQNEIDEYFKKYNSIFFHLLENEVNADNYKKPLYQYFYSIGSSLNINSVSVNNINLSPLDIEIKQGIIVPKSKKFKTYSFEENRRVTWENKNNKKILSIFNYWIQNSGNVIKGSYRTLYDILPNIGGFIHLIHFVFYCINFLYNQYITLVHCNELIFRMTNTDDPKSLNIKKILYDDIITIRDEIKFRDESRFLKDMKKRDSIYITKKARQKRKSEKENNKSINYNNFNNDNDKNNNLSNSNDLMNNLPKNNLIMNNITVIKNVKTNNNYNYSSKKIGDNINNITFKNDEKLNFQFSSQIKEYFNNKDRDLKEEPLNATLTSLFITFFNYIMSLLRHPEKKRIFSILNNFREKILSEEHIFKSNIILFHLEKYFDIQENKKIDVLDLYDNL